MENFGDRLKAARLRKGLKQSDVAAHLDCAPTSLTNWEKGNVQPSVDVLARLCEVLEVSPLELLGKQYSYEDIAAIAAKPAYMREYEEQIALNFAGDILEKLLPAEKIRQETERIEQTALFIKATNLLDRFGGSMERADIDAMKKDYDRFGAADADILFAFHALDKGSKVTFLSVLRGFLSVQRNIQPIADNMEKAVAYTDGKLSGQAEVILSAIEDCLLF